MFYSESWIDFFLYISSANLVKILLLEGFTFICKGLFNIDY